MQPALPSYAPHEAFIAPARKRAEFWRLIAGCMLIVVAAVLPLLLLRAYLADLYGSFIAYAFMQRVAHGDTPGGMLALFWSFAGLLLGPMAAVRLFHRRPAGTLFGPSPARATADFLQVSGAIIGLQLLLLPLMLTADEIRPGLDFGAFLGYLPFALPGLLIQTGSEELVFRGYIQQQLAARFRHPAIWMGLPSALFAWGHYSPEVFGSDAGMTALWAFAFGLLAADLTARTGSIGAAIGLHFANNVAATLLVGLQNNLDGLALWSLALNRVDGGGFDPVLIVDFAGILVSWLLARLVLRV